MYRRYGLSIMELQKKRELEFDVLKEQHSPLTNKLFNHIQLCVKLSLPSQNESNPDDEHVYG